MVKKQIDEQSGIVRTFEEVAAIFSANGIEINESILELMSPLLEGRQNLEEHRAGLKAKLDGLA